MNESHGGEQQTEQRSVSLESVGSATQSLPEQAVYVLDHADMEPGVGGEDAARLTLILCDLAHSSAVTRVSASMALVLTTSKRLWRHRIGCVRHQLFSTLYLHGRDVMRAPGAASSHDAATSRSGLLGPTEAWAARLA